MAKADSHHTAQTLAAPCPVEALGRELGRIWAASDRLQALAKVGEFTTEGRPVSGVHEMLAARQGSVEDAIPTYQATSLAGALVDVVRAHALLATLKDETAPAIGDHAPGVIQLFRQIDAVLYSATNMLRTATPGAWEAIAGNMYMDPAFDPFAALERAEGARIPEREAA